MISLLICFVLLFGLLGIFIGQYIMQYREAYAIWIRYIIYNGMDPHSTCEDKIDLCSKLESYSREICELSHMIIIIFVGISITFILIVYGITTNISLIENDATTYYSIVGIDVLSSNPELNSLLAARFLTFILFSGLIFVLNESNINIFKTSKTSPIDEKIFDVWCEIKCESCKKIKNDLEPRRLYEIWAEKINSGKSASPEVRERLKSLLKDKNICKRP